MLIREDNKYNTIRLEKVKRGEVYYFKTNLLINSQVQSRSRPYIVLSNDTGNTFSNICLVAPITSKEKKPMPTHCKIYSTGIESSVLTEQITCMSQNDISGDCIGVVTENELEEIEKCMLISLGIKCNSRNGYKTLEKYYDELEKQLIEKNFVFNTDNYLTKLIKVPVIEKTEINELLHIIDNNDNNSKLRELEIENATLKAKLNVYEDWYNKFMSNTLK